MTFVALKTDDAVPFGDAEVERLAAGGVELRRRHCPTEDELTRHGAEVDALLVVAEPVSARVIAALPRLRAIARFGAGLDNVDVEAASAHGVQVTYVPGASAPEVSDHTLAMLLTLARRLPTLDAAVRGGYWALQATPPPLRRLDGQTLGIVGFGRIGGLVAAKAAAFGLVPAAFDPYAPAERFAAAGVRQLPLDELLATSDHVTIHTALTDETRHLIGARELALMRPTATLVNVARGGIVDQDALADALEAGRLAGAGLDVLEREPPAAGERLLALPNVIFSPHLAHYSHESMDDLRTSVIDDVVAVLSGAPPRFPVNEVAAPR
jgi:D-3-phosphoglycerate dehydrogenase